MMKQRRILCLSSIGVMVVFAAVWLLPTSRYLIIGYLTDEPWAEARSIRYDGNVITESAHTERRPVSVWITQLRDEDAARREQAARALGSIGPSGKPAVRDLVRAMRDEHPRVRVAAIEALGKIGPDSRAAVPGLIRIYQDRNEQEHVRQTVVATLGALGSAAKDGVPVMIRLLADDEPFALPSHVQSAVTRMGPEAVDDLVRLLQDEEAEVRAHAAVALNWIGPAARCAVPALIKALQDEDPRVRRVVASALRTIDPDADSKEQVE